MTQIPVSPKHRLTDLEYLNKKKTGYEAKLQILQREWRKLQQRIRSVKKKGEDATALASLQLYMDLEKQNQETQKRITAKLAIINTVLKILSST